MYLILCIFIRKKICHFNAQFHVIKIPLLYKKYTSGNSKGQNGTKDYNSILNNVVNSAAQTAANTASTADSASKIAKSVDITSEDLKYLRDIAERDVINRYTTASITVKQTNHNTVNNEMDLDGVTEHLRSTMEEQMAAAAEGVH